MVSSTSCLRLAITFALSLGALSARAQSFDNVGGAWWFQMGGKDAGALLVQLEDPNGPTTQVQDVDATGRASFGFSRDLESFYRIAAGQTLEAGAKGDLSGTLVLSDPNSAAPLGVLAIEQGKANKKFTRLELRGTIEAEDGAPRKVKLKGRRLEAEFPQVTGASPVAAVNARNLIGQLSMIVEPDAELGLPAYTIDGIGTVWVGSQNQDMAIAGRAMLAPNGRLFGSVEGLPFNAGSLSGSLRAPNGNPPRLRILMQADRSPNIRTNLFPPEPPVPPVEP